jgi:sporulation protein YlmC with PRC-barrel domain
MGIVGRQMEELLEQTVVMKGIRIGRVVDVILGARDGEIIGFEVHCKDGQHRFLPSAAATREDRTIVIHSPFALLDADQLEFYRRRGRTLRTREEPAA